MSTGREQAAPKRRPSVSSETETLERVPAHLNTAVEGIEKVFVPFFEFECLVSFDNGMKATSRTYWCDAILLDCRPAPDDRRAAFYPPPAKGDTVLPGEHPVAAARSMLMKRLIDNLPSELNRSTLDYNLSLEYTGSFHRPFWVAYYKPHGKSNYDFIVLTSLDGEPDSRAKEIVDRGFLLLDQKARTTPPWF